jgi:hypothetical protein
MRGQMPKISGFGNWQCGKENKIGYRPPSSIRDRQEMPIGTGKDL